MRFLDRVPWFWHLESRNLNWFFFSLVQCAKRKENAYSGTSRALPSPWQMIWYWSASTWVNSNFWWADPVFWFCIWIQSRWEKGCLSYKLEFPNHHVYCPCPHQSGSHHHQHHKTVFSTARATFYGNVINNCYLSGLTWHISVEDASMKRPLCLFLINTVQPFKEPSAIFKIRTVLV